MREYLSFMLIGICVVLSIFSFVTNFKSNRKKYALLAMSISSMMLLIVDKLAYMLDGNEKYWIIAYICKFLVFFLLLAIIYSFNQYLIALFLNDGELKEVPKEIKHAQLIIYLSVMMLVISQFTGIYYEYENYTYHRSGGFVIAYILPMISLFLDLFVILKYRKIFRKQILIPILFFIIMPVLSAFLRLFWHCIEFVNVSIIGMVGLLYMFSIFDNNKLIEQEQQTIKNLISQITLALVEAIDAKDSYTNGHSKRVAEYSKKIAEMANKTEKECEEIYMIALLHDVGKIGIPGAIINKEGKLTDEEYAVIKKHPGIGKEILEKIKASPDLCIGAHYHHERFDGKGYPEGLSAYEIPEIARIIAVADAYDAMTSKRSYRDSLPQGVVKEQLQKGMGSQFDPVFAKIMISLIDSDTEYTMRQLKTT